MTQKNDFMVKLNDIQTKLEAPKGQRNSFGNYNYRSCEDILAAVKPLLKEHGLVLTVTDEVVVLGSSTLLEMPTFERFYVKATATITDGEKELCVHGYAREAETKKGMDDSQVTGATSSYARKYALNGLFAIDDTKDADTDEYQNKSGGVKKEVASDKTTSSEEAGDLFG